VPHILYHHYHMNHHFGTNDKKGPDGTTKDWSSIYRYGKDDEPGLLALLPGELFRVKWARLRVLPGTAKEQSRN